MKGKYERGRDKKQKIEVWSWIKCILAAVLIAVVLRVFVFEMVVVQGDSMAPGLHTGQVIFVEKVSKRFTEPDHGDVVVVKYSDVDERYYVKRVMGLPGDTLEIRKGILYRNGEQLNEDYLLEALIFNDMYEITVPEDHIFVMGDNRNDSMDSRNSLVGPIPDRDIVGVGKFVFLPFNEMKGLG